MYRLLIVDNERAIAESIKEMFLNLSDPELDVYTAYSAEEALSKIKKYFLLMFWSVISVCPILTA